MGFLNLSVEMTRAGLTQKALAEKTSMRKDTLNRKMSGKSEFVLSELKAIRDCINPDLKLEYLFAEGLANG